MENRDYHIEVTRFNEDLQIDISIDVHIKAQNLIQALEIAKQEIQV